MTTPNIEMIADSLRNCSLTGRIRGGGGVRPPPVRSPPPPMISDETAEVTVELNSEVGLPYHWEQCLDMRTGTVYYRNWATGKRTTEDPRRHHINTSYYVSSSSSSEEAKSSEEDDDDDDSSNEDNSEEQFSAQFSAESSSSSSSVYSPEVNSSDSQVLVAAGCKYCFMYFMVPKQDSHCPNCGRLLLHLGRTDCF